MLIRKTLYCEFKTLGNFNLALGAGERGYVQNIHLEILHIFTWKFHIQWLIVFCQSWPWKFGNSTIQFERNNSDILLEFEAKQ